MIQNQKPKKLIWFEIFKELGRNLFSQYMFCVYSCPLERLRLSYRKAKKENKGWY
jgi:hypothetical protein